MSQPTIFGSLKHFQKGGVEIIDADPKHYVHSNVFDVASRSKAYEKVCVAQNLKYVLEAIRADGTSPWFATAHDEAALCMDGEIEVHLVKPDQAAVAAEHEGAIKLGSEPQGKKMGWLKIRRGHMALLPKGSAYQFRSAQPSVILLQTMKGPLTIERWAEICQTTA
jgi:hypothetical protein